MPVPRATTSSAGASASASASASFTVGGNLKIVGILLAITSGLLIGSSFVFKKKGLLRAQAGHAAGEGVAYLKSPLWWIGMTMMILGELCNFAAYAFVEAIVVTPLGALSVVICAILSSIFLNEKLTFFGWLGCTLCILGSVIIALNGPSEATVGQITEFQKLFLSVGFLVYAGLLITAALVIIFFAAPRWGKKSMLWYIFVCSMIGGISVSVTTGLGSAIVTTAGGDNQFKHWFIYFLIGFVAITLITEVYYLNVALALFNTVTPTYYVIFTFFSIVTTIVLFKGLSAPVSSIITLVMGFLVICVGITILQMSKVDPEQLSKKLDRRSTILLQAARSQTETMEEKSVLGVEDPGMDALRGSFGTVGSIIRARSARRLSQSSAGGRPPGAMAPYDRTRANSTNPRVGADSIQRHQLYDAPMSSLDVENQSTRSDSNATRIQKRTTIKFGTEDVVHQYHPTGPGNSST
ncbi:magnesium transporter NIPA-domain-containing protein [Mycena amicta]|nr:magnesium transporter NIPA-domain-containing protein [Mycena amicta]